MPLKDWAALEDKIGYRFRDRELLEKAVTHTSYANELPPDLHSFHYERLEFLGDAVLEAVSSAFLYQRFPNRKEGELTRLRAALVCEPSLAFCARKLGLDVSLRLGRGEEESGGRSKDSIVSDVLEAVIGAIFLDSGEDLAAPRAFIEKHVLSDIEERELFYDAKSILQERAQQNGKSVRYELTDEQGPAHARVYTSTVFLDGIPAGTGTGSSKKESQQQAAFTALKAEKAADSKRETEQTGTCI